MPLVKFSSSFDGNILLSLLKKKQEKMKKNVLTEALVSQFASY